MNSSSGQFEGNLLELSDEVQILVRAQTLILFLYIKEKKVIFALSSMKSLAWIEVEKWLEGSLEQVYSF